MRRLKRWGMKKKGISKDGMKKKGISKDKNVFDRKTHMKHITYEAHQLACSLLPILQPF